MNSENDKIGFIYSFNMGEDIAHFKLMPEHIQSSAECCAVDVIYESFVITGDQDYLMSRLLAQKGLPRGFYWAAAQAIEKYLKAFLLMNGESVKKLSNGHSIKALFKAACSIDSALSDLNILPHPSIQVESTVSHHLKRFGISDFIEDLERYGNAANRYNTFGVGYNTGHLCAMDSLSYRLRGKIGVIPISDSFRRLSSDLIIIFNKNNPWFNEKENQAGCEASNGTLPIQYLSNTTKLDILIKNKNNPAYKLALQWLDAKMKL